MPTHNTKVKTPSMYAIGWHDFLRIGFEHVFKYGGKYEDIIFEHEDFKKVRAARNHFRAFKKVLLETPYPHHPLRNVVVQCEIWTKEEQLPDGRWGLRAKLWQSWKVSWLKLDGQ